MPRVLALAILVCAWRAALAAGPPPEVDFIGRAPRVRLSPGGGRDGNDTWVALSFERIQELDAQGARVPGRAITSLASAEGIAWSQENRSVAGTFAVVTRVEVPLGYGETFRELCGAGAPLSLAGLLPRDAPGATASDSSVGSIVVEFFVFQEDATVEYGDFVMDVARGQMKFNIEGASWPFCGTDHRLEITLNIRVPGDRPPKEIQQRPEEVVGDQAAAVSVVEPSSSSPAPATLHLDRSPSPAPPRRRRPRTKWMRQSAGGRDVDFDFPESALVDNSSAACEVYVDSRPGRTDVVFTFTYFAEAMLYDPTIGFVEPPAEAATTSTAAPVAAATEAVVSGSLRMAVEEPAEFCIDTRVLLGLRSAFARATRQSPSSVDLSCARVVARRLARRLAGSVHIDYDIAVPAALGAVAAPPGPGATLAALQAVTVEELTTIVNEELAGAGSAALVQVTEKAEPSVEVVAQTTPRAAVALAAPGRSLHLFCLALALALPAAR